MSRTVKPTLFTRTRDDGKAAGETVRLLLSPVFEIPA